MHHTLRFDSNLSRRNTFHVLTCKHGIQSLVARVQLTDASLEAYLTVPLTSNSRALDLPDSRSMAILSRCGEDQYTVTCKGTWPLCCLPAGVSLLLTGWQPQP